MTRLKLAITAFLPIKAYTGDHSDRLHQLLNTRSGNLENIKSGSRRQENVDIPLNPAKIVLAWGNRVESLPNA
jgi:hypothetical protein